MSKFTPREKQVKALRYVRKIHRTTGILLFIFFFVIGTTGLLLGWKKHSGGAILAHTSQGTSSDLSQWLSLDSLKKVAVQTLHDSFGNDLDPELERIDVREEKGVVKFVFAKNYWGIQVDGKTGKVLQIERRNADMVENIHDGSILDFWAGTRGEIIKLIYTTIMGLALITFTVTGFWLWVGPKMLKRH